MEELKQVLKQQVLETLNLEEVAVADIEDATPLFGEGLGLDSIDALELVMMLDREYGIKIVDKETLKRALFCINSLTEFVAANRKK